MLALINIKMLFLAMIYSGVSRAYSWTGIRLKKYPVIGWLTVILFQGGYTFLLGSMAAENNFTGSWFSNQKWECMLIATMLIGAYYPLTQIYQHEEDSSRGDITISYILGIRGTFVFSALMFLLSFVLAFHYFQSYYSINQFYYFIISLLPAIIFFMYWGAACFRNRQKSDFRNAMLMTVISSSCLLICFSILLYINHF